MYRNYFLKQGFFAKKGNEQDPNVEKVFIKHEPKVGGIYATIKTGEKKGVNIVTDGQKEFFNNFNDIDLFLANLKLKQENFVKILKRKDISQKLRLLEI